MAEKKESRLWQASSRQIWIQVPALPLVSWGKSLRFAEPRRPSLPNAKLCQAHGRLFAFVPSFICILETVH